jgi:hypothetical protein
MGFPIGKVLSIAMRVFGVIQSAVPAVEAAAATFGHGSGPQKKAAVMELVTAELEAAELVAGTHLATDLDVLQAAGAISDAYVTFQRVLARKITSATGGT